MKCARLHLQNRTKQSAKQTPPTDKPRRYCQKRMVNPEHCEDPLWTDPLKRFHCNSLVNVNLQDSSKDEADISTRNEEDLYLTVQNLKFQGSVPDHKRPRTSFKYKSLTDNRRHRMFVKQVVEENFNYEEERSHLDSYFDEYVKYLQSVERSSRPSSSKESTCQQTNKFEEKSIQVDNKLEKTDIKNPRAEPKSNISIKAVKYNVGESKEDKNDNNVTEDVTVAYHKAGKRKSLTISRAPSPETVQVIRVDVVCNYSSSSIISDSEDKKLPVDVKKLSDKEIAKMNFKGSHFTDKYLLTKTIKSVDENLSCGSKVTLLCKTFRLSHRNKLANKKYKKTMNDSTVISKMKQIVH